MSSPTQTTLVDSIECCGISVHRGTEVRVSLQPAPADTGVVFRCLSHEPFVDVPALFDSVVGAAQSTQLGLGEARVSTVEHLLAALRALGLDNVVVETDGEELPILDGSAGDWIALLRQAGSTPLGRPRRSLVVEKPVEVVWGERHISISPSEGFSFRCEIDFDHPLIGHQTIDIPELTADVFVSELAGARTFGFEADAERLREAGLARGASLENTLVLSEEGLLNADGLRWPDEFVRHKAVDLVGDLALLGAPLVGHVEVHRGGHALHHALIEALISDPEALAWSDAREDEAANGATRQQEEAGA